MQKQPRPLLDELAKFVRQRRKHNRMSQAELADLAGVGRRFVSDLEAGKKPTLQLEKVDAVLEVFGGRLAIRTRREDARESGR